MKIIFAFDKKHDKEHYKVNHSDISEQDIYEFFENVYIEFKNEKHIKTLIGHTNEKKFLIIVGVFDKNKEKFKLITTYRAKRKQIIFWKNEVYKQ